MKNLIAYYYNIYITQYKKSKDKFQFEYNGKKHSFVLFEGDPETLYKNYLIIKKSNKYCHKILMNKDGSMITMYNSKPFVLMREDFFIDKCVDINEIISYDSFVGQNYSLTWKRLWEQKIDYYEYQMSQVSFKYPKIKESFNYYLGLTETAISILNYVDKSAIDYFISHKRVFSNETLDEFFNPLEIVIDSRARDLAEFIKTNYIYQNLNINDIYFYIDSFNFNSNESLLFFARIMYPSYYFDQYDEIIQGKISEEKAELLTKKNADYEVFLKKIYAFLRKKNSLPNIEWLNS